MKVKDLLKILDEAEQLETRVIELKSNIGAFMLFDDHDRAGLELLAKLRSQLKQAERKLKRHMEMEL